MGITTGVRQHYARLVSADDKNGLTYYLIVGVGTSLRLHRAAQPVIATR